MSLAAIATADDQYTARWQQWQAAYRISSRQGTGRAVVFVTILLAALAAALAQQLVGGPWS